jgi:hypothetical protein
MKIKTRQKMKRQIYKSGFLLIFSLFLASAVTIAQEVSKKFHQEYKAGPNTTLDISNKYGDVIVETSDQNQITIDVKVTVELPSRDRAEKLLSYIDVQFSEDGDLIKAKTIIDDKFNFSGWGGGLKRFSIDYNVKMPSNINFNLSNRYGNSELEEIKGLAKLDIKYGDLTADNLDRGNDKPWNFLSLAYGKAQIESAGWLDVSVRYSGSFMIQKCQALLLDSKYSKIQIGEVSSGSLNVDKIPSGFEMLETDTRYIGVKLAIDSDASYELDAKLSYGDLKFDENNFQHQRRIVENNSSETAGIVGKESSPSSKVTVRASYGSVRLY